MQILLLLRPEKPLNIPFNYNYQLQSALYALLHEVGASDFWHDRGFRSYDISYKGFCFGKLKGEYQTDMESKKMCFTNDISLEVRSVSFDFIDALQRALEQHPYIQLFDTRLDVVGASLMNRHIQNEELILKAETPIVIHQTLEDGHTYYFGPDDDDYFTRICNNARKKYETIRNEEAGQISLSPCSALKKVVTRYKGIYLTGYTGELLLSAPIKMSEFLYNTGLGEKNSQGFGFVQVKGNKQ